jgi:hypothetical protein
MAKYEKETIKMMKKLIIIGISICLVAGLIFGEVVKADPPPGKAPEVVMETGGDIVAVPAGEDKNIVLVATDSDRVHVSLTLWVNNANLEVRLRVNFVSEDGTKNSQGITIFGEGVHTVAFDAAYNESNHYTWKLRALSSALSETAVAYNYTMTYPEPE